MAIQYELYRHDLTTLGFNAAATGLIPKSGSAFLRRKGATVTVDGSIGGAGSATLTVSDVGTIVPGDVVQVNGAGATGTVNLSAYTRTTLNITWAVAAAWVAGNRLTLVTPNAQLFRDPFGVLPVAQPVGFGSATGLLTVYSRVPELDVIRTVDSVLDIIPDQAGLGGRWGLSPLDWEAKFDDSSDDEAAFENALLVAQVRGLAVLELPPGTARIGGNISINSLAGLIIRGSGKSVTKLMFTTAAAQWIITNSTDVVFEDLTIGRTVAGSTHLSFISTSSRCGFRNVHFTKGSGVCLDSGTDSIFDNCSADGDSWNGGFYLLGATRPTIRRFVGRLANSFGTPFIDIDQATKSPRITDLDVVPSDIGSFSFPVVRVRNSGAGAGPNDVIFTSPHLVAGTAGTPRPCVEVLAPSGGGQQPFGVTFGNAQCEDSERAFNITGGRGINISKLRSVGMTQECIYLRDGAGVVSIDHIESSHIGTNLAHVRVAPTAFDIHIDHVKGGNFLRAAAGNTAQQVVLLEDGVGANIWVGPAISRFVTADSNQVVTNNKIPGSGAQRAQVHVFHSQESSSTSVTADHDGVAFYERHYADNDTTPNVEGVSALTLSYGAGISITNFDVGKAGQILFVTNVGANSITMVHAAGLLEHKSGADVVLAVNESIAYYKSKKATKGWLEIDMTR